MSQDLTKDPIVETSFFELDNEGRTQEVCMVTGKILRRAQTALDLLEDKKVEKAPTGTVPIFKYHEAYGQIISKLVSEGKTIKYITELQGMPSRNQISNWLVKHDEFSKMMDQARKDRAEVHFDEIAEDKDEDHDASKDEVQARKLKLDRLKFLASKGDPDRFGDRTKVSGDSDAPLQIVVSTGIVRAPKVEE